MISNRVLSIMLFLAACHGGLLYCAPIVVNFGSFPKWTGYAPGDPIPTAYRCYDQFLSQGVLFTSGSQYVAVAWQHYCQENNGISPTAPDGTLRTGVYPITITFVTPGNSSYPAITDYVSVKGDKCGVYPGNFTLKAFDVDGHEIGSYTKHDGYEVVLEVGVAGIHSVQFMGTPTNDNGIGLVEVAFNAPIPVVPVVVKPVVLTRSAIGISDTSATLRGTLDSDAGEACEYRFSYKKSGDSYYTDTTWTGSVRTGDKFSQPITGLTLGATYYFKAKAKNSHGEAEGSELWFTTSLLSLKRFEINQCFQGVVFDDSHGTWDQKYTLIAEKPFAVRVRLGNSGTSVVEVKLGLQIYRTGTTTQVGTTKKTPVTPIPIAGTADFTFQYLESESVNFQDNYYDFRLVAESKYGTTLMETTSQQRFEGRKSITLLVVPFIFNNTTPQWQDGYAEFIRKIFPVRKINITLAWPQLANTTDFNVLAAMLEVARSELGGDFACGLLPGGALGLTVGQARRAGNDLVVVVGDTAPFAIGHELGHCNYLYEEYLLKACYDDNLKKYKIDNPTFGFGDGKNEPPLERNDNGEYRIVSGEGAGLNYKETSAPHEVFILTDKDHNCLLSGKSAAFGGNWVGEGGYDVKGVGFIATNTLCMMGWASDNQWITGPEYGALLGSDKLKAARSQAAMASMNSAVDYSFLSSFDGFQRVLIHGFIDPGQQTGRLYPLIHLNNLEPSSQVLDSDYILFFKTKAGTLVGQHPFTPSLECEGQPGRLGFSAIVVLPPETWTIELSGNGIVLAVLTRSESSPVMHIVSSPEGILGETGTLAWSASDQDGDTLEYAVEFSCDGRLDWYSIGFGIKDQQFTFKTDDLPGGSNCLIKVIASDGWNQAEDTSRPFIVPTKPPKITILDPEQGHVWSATGTMEGRCVARDLETGEITDPNAIVWSSDVDGVLGRGNLIGFELSPGSHVLTVTATDPEGKSTSVSVNVEVAVTETDLRRMSPIAHWTFDEGKGDVARDAVGTNHGTVYGASWETGKVGGALGFDGQNDYVACGQSPLLAPETLTLAFWTRREFTNELWPYAISKTAGGLFDRDYTLSFYRSGKVEFSFGNDSSSCMYLKSVSAVPTNEWTHIAVVRDGQHASIYLNGKLDIAKEYSFIPENKGQPLVVGSFIGTCMWFKGKIDDLRLYDWALSQKKIGNLFEETSR